MLAVADAYSYLHLLLVSGIIVSAIGLKAGVAHVAEPLSDGARLALCGGVALYLGGHVAFGLRLAGEAGVDKALAAVGCLAIFILGAGRRRGRRSGWSPARSRRSRSVRARHHQPAADDRPARLRST